MRAETASERLTSSPAAAATRDARGHDTLINANQPFRAWSLPTNWPRQRSAPTTTNRARLDVARRQRTPLRRRVSSLSVGASSLAGFPVYCSPTRSLGAMSSSPLSAINSLADGRRRCCCCCWHRRRGAMQCWCRSLFALIRDMVRIKRRSTAAEEAEEEEGFEQVWRKSATACMEPDTSATADISLYIS